MRRLLLLSLLLFAAVPARANVMTFDDGVSGVLSYTEAGLVAQYGSVFSDEPPTNIPQPLLFQAGALVTRIVDYTMTIHSVDYAPFHPVSADICVTLFDDPMIIVGSLFGHIRFREGVPTLDPFFGSGQRLTNLHGSCFTELFAPDELISRFWWYNSGHIAFDNFVFTPVPEPGTLALVLSGALFLAVAVARAVKR